MIKNYYILLLFTLALSSCKVLTSTDMFRTAPDYVYDSTKLEHKEIRISPSDQLSIMMVTNNGINLLESSVGAITGGSGAGNNLVNTTTSAGGHNGMTYFVEFDSTIKVPSIGRIKIAGLTIREAESMLECLFSENYQSPYVKVKITNRKVILFSELGTHAAIIPLPEENMTLVDAIAHAGGMSPNTKSYKIKVLRGDPHSPLVFNFNIRNLEDYKRTNLLLEANDIIYLESRPRYVDKVISELQPYLVLISTAILVYNFVKNPSNGL